MASEPNSGVELPNGCRGQRSYQIAQQINHIAESHSINHPPYFNGEDYPYWKDRMRLFIESTSLDMWEIIENGDYIPIVEQPAPQVVADPEQPPSVIVKTISRNEWTDQHKTKIQMNAKAKYLLTYALCLEQK